MSCKLAKIVNRMLRFSDLSKRFGTRAERSQSQFCAVASLMKMMPQFGEVHMKKQIALLCFSLAAVSSQATVVFNTFGPGDSTSSSGWGYGDLFDTRVASQFTSSESGTLDVIKVKLLAGGGTGVSTISLFEDSGNDIGTLMASFTVDVTTAGVKTITNTDPSLELVAGGKYWLEAKSAVGSNVYGGWNINNQNIRGFLKFGAVLGNASNPTSTYTVGNNALLPGFSVEVSPVPEPASMLALGLVASAVAVRRRKKN